MGHMMQTKFTRDINNCSLWVLNALSLYTKTLKLVDARSLDM